MMVVRIGLQPAKFFLVIPAQDWRIFFEELVGVIHVSEVAVDANLEPVSLRKSRPYFEEELILGKFFGLGNFHLFTKRV